MADLKTTQKEMIRAENRMKTFSDPNLAANVENYITTAYKPVLESSTRSTQQQMAEYLPKFFGITNQGLAGGTDASSLTPQQKLALAGRELGLMGGQLAQSSQLTDALGGSLNTMRGNALNALRDSRGSAQEAYNRQFQLYQLAFQAQEAERQRQFQAQEAARARAMARGGGGGGAQAIQGLPTLPPKDVMLAFQSGRGDLIWNAMKNWEKQTGGYKPEVHEDMWRQWRELTYGRGAGAVNQSDIDAGRFKF